jgi:hypothetical protein
MSSLVGASVKQKVSPDAANAEPGTQKIANSKVALEARTTAEADNAAHGGLTARIRCVDGTTALL